MQYVLLFHQHPPQSIPNRMRLIMQLVGRGRQVWGGALHLGSHGETRTLHGQNLRTIVTLGGRSAIASN